MSITVRYFASIRENVGKSEEAIDANGIFCVRDVWQRVSDKPVPDRLLAAVNQEYADLQQHVRDGDEVAFFPPVTGG
jgi:molybdopterin synthase sulfur carrier subunit